LLGRIGQLANRIEQIQQRLRLLGMGEAAVPGLDFAAWLQQATLQDSAGQAAASAGLPQLAGSSSPQLTTGGRFDDMIAQVAARHGLDPDLLHAIVKVESDYNPRCVSSAGAKGLMQLMPGTARYLGVEDIFDPQQNLEGGARYLKEQLERFGDPVLALAAYNAGPGAVAQYHGVPPYEETQAYVPRVLEYYRARRVASQQPAAGTTPTTHPATDANASSAPPRASLRPDADAVAAAQSVSTAPSRDLVQQPARRNAQVPSEPQRLKPAPSQPLNPLAEGVSTELTADSAVVKLAARPADIPQPTSAAIAKAPVLLVGQASRLSPVPLTEPAQPAVPTAQVADAEPAVVISRDAPTATVVKPPQTAPEASPPQTESTASAKAPVLLVGQASRLSPVTLTEPAQPAAPTVQLADAKAAVGVTDAAPRMAVATLPHIGRGASLPQAESAASAKAPVLLVGQASRLSPVPLTEPAQPAAPTVQLADAKAAVGVTDAAPRMAVATLPHIGRGASPPQTESTARAEAPATAAKSAQVTATIAGAEPPRQPAQQPAVGVPAPGLLIGSELAAALEQRLSELVAAGADRLRLAEAVTLPRQEITIELAPPELGRVQIAFELEHEAASVEVRTETFSTAAHLESSFRGLATSLEQLGLKLASLKVSCDAGGFGPNHEGTGQSASWQQQASAGWQALGAGGAGQNAGSGGEAFTFAETAHIPGGDETTPIGQRPAHFTSGLQRSRPARLVSVLDVAA